MIAIFIFSFIASALISILLIRLNRRICVMSDPVSGGPQKFHCHPVPRVGGVAIFSGLIIAGVVMSLSMGSVSSEYWLLLASAISAFAGGLIEDLTKKAGIIKRLVLTMLSAGVGVYLLGAVLNRIDIPIFDNAFSFLPFAIAFTVFAVGGIANAINIIDGFNGIASTVSLLIISSIGYVSYLVGDSFLAASCLSGCGAILGFWVWNYPSGLIFLGDGGAYLLGFLIGELSVLLVNRHPQVSVWFPLLLAIYPVTETIFSIYRRKFVRGTSPGFPDVLHLHSLAYKRLIRWMVGSKDAKHITRRNAMTAPYLWTITIISVLPALIFWKNPLVLICLVIAFILLYIWIYWRIVRFKTPKWLIVRRHSR